MAAPLQFIELDGLEVANAARTFEYIRKLQGHGRHFDLGDVCICQVLFREAGHDGIPAVFTSPAADPAPWYSVDFPESANFYGLLLTDLDGWDLDIARSVTDRVGGIEGATLGPEHLKGREFRARGFMIASSCAGLEYGRRWLAEHLGTTNCDTCLTRTIKVRDHCPEPDNGTNDSQGLWYAYEVGLTQALKETDNEGLDRCCDAVEVTFTITAQNPFLYKDPVACISETQLNPTISAVASLYELDTTILDTFTRADSPTLGSNWSGPLTTTSRPGLAVSLNTAVQSDVAVTCESYWNTANGGTGGMAAAATIVTKSNAGNGQIWVFAMGESFGTANARGYAVRANTVGAGSDTVSLHRMDNGVVSTISGPSNHEFSAGDRVAVVCTGARVQGWVKPVASSTWTMLLDVADATYATGRYSALEIAPGAAETVHSSLDDFTAGPWGCGDLSFCAWFQGAPPAVCCSFTEPTAYGITGAIVTLTAGDAALNNVTISSYEECPVICDEFSGSGALLSPWARDGANTIVQSGGSAIPGAGLGVTYRYRRTDKTWTDSRSTVKFTTAGTGVDFTFGLTARANITGTDTLLYGRFNATTAAITKRVAGVETILSSGVFIPAISTSYWLALTVRGDDLRLDIFTTAPFYPLDSDTPVTPPVMTVTYTLTPAELAAFTSGEVGFRWAPGADSGAMDDFCVEDLALAATTQMSVSSIPAGYILIINSARHVVTLVAPDGTQSDGSSLIELEEDMPVQWVEASLCEPGACLCVRLDHFCDSGEEATVSIDTQVRAR